MVSSLAANGREVADALAHAAIVAGELDAQLEATALKLRGGFGK